MVVSFINYFHYLLYTYVKFFFVFNLIILFSLITFGLLFVLSCVNNGAITADFSPTGARLTQLNSNTGSNSFPANLERIKGTQNFRMNGWFYLF